MIITNISCIGTCKLDYKCCHGCQNHSSEGCQHFIEHGSVPVLCRGYICPAKERELLRS
jgi:hypothetical protein